MFVSTLITPLYSDDTTATLISNDETPALLSSGALTMAVRKPMRKVTPHFTASSLTVD